MDNLKCKKCGTEYPTRIINKYDGYCRNCYNKKNNKRKSLIKKIFILLILFVLLVALGLNRNIQEEVKNMGYIILVVIISIIGFLIISDAVEKQEKTVSKNREEIEDRLKGYNISKNISFVRYGVGGSEIDVKLDTEKRKILICYYYLNSTEIVKVPFEEIIECEVIEDKNTVMKGGVGRAVVGGVLAGGVGAIVGANTRASKNMIYNLQIRIITSNINNSLCTIDIINNMAGVNIDSYEYKNGIVFANEVYATIVSIINQNKKQEDKESLIKDNNTEGNYFKQLEQLNDLRGKGIITQEEFETKKRELLNKI